jgi:hypothetical protein
VDQDLLDSQRLAQVALQHVAAEFHRVTGTVLPMTVIAFEENGVTLGVAGEDWVLGSRVGWCEDADEALWLVADLAQDVFIERYRAFWPECVAHRVPLSVTGIEGTTVPHWVCRLTTEHHVVRPIGELTPADARFSPGWFGREADGEESRT